MLAEGESAGSGGPQAFVDLHSHSSFSFDSLSKPADLVRVAAERGLTHLAITDHERLDGALEGRAHAPAGLTVIVGEEIRTADGDMLGLYLTEVVAPGMSAAETVDAIHAQGGLAGLPHPFDHYRNSGLRGEREAAMVALAPRLDFIEAYNARAAFGDANARAAEFAVRNGLPGVASSDAHSLLEVGVACTIVPGPIETPDQLRAALAHATLMPGHASYLARGLTPLAKLINRTRGNRRVRPRG
ncbi:MAG TPA: PHP domain-containing protein [Candidatus Sulfotelmatobacter sp.]|nr:PHP domain-containing protein [Candidatus Sulfotelmatobacter sp.]